MGAKKGSLARIIGESIKFKDDTGDEILVPSDQNGSKMALMVMAAQVRSLLQETINGYKQRGVALTPTELKQVADAAKAIATFQGEVYGGTPPSPKGKVAPPRGMTPVSDSGADTIDADLDFSSLTKKPEPTRVDDNQ